ncbi:MAG: hypothetical protein P8N02_15840 [Actinomycetota bacterium]|nr:hypothetical protein [Actinomycetota bacterium]
MGASGHVLEVGVFLGPDLLPFLVLAMGGAMLVGNLLALVRPREEAEKDDELAKAPLGRSLAMIIVGLVATIWAIATLTS